MSRRDRRSIVIPRRGAAGFTLIELLLVIAIISLLVSMSIPAVQSAREASRRMQCSNNMRQHGLALIAFDSVHGEFPSAMSFQVTGPLVDSKWRAWTYLTDILTRLGAAPEGAFDYDAMFFDPRNRDVVAQAYPITICPSTPSRDPQFRSTFEPSRSLPPIAQEHLPGDLLAELDNRYTATYDAAASDYGVFLGIERTFAESHGYELQDGEFYVRSMFPLPVTSLDDLLLQIGPILVGSGTVLIQRGTHNAEITDGLTATLLMAEIAGRPQHWVGDMRQPADEPIDRPWCDPRSLQMIEGRPLLQSDNAHGPYSFHNGVINMLYVDGHVAPLADSTEDRVVLSSLTPGRAD